MLADEDSLQKYRNADMAQIMAAIEAAARVKEKYDESWIVENARRAVALAAHYGTTHIRAFADVDPKARLEGIKALTRIRDEFKGIVEIQVAAFTQEGIVREPGTTDLVRQAMEMGTDIVAGYPWHEYTDADVIQHVKEVFDIAQQYDRDVSMMTDEAGDPGARSLEIITVETIKRGWEGRTLAHNPRAMALYPKPYLEKVVGLLKKAKIGIVNNPHNSPLHAPIKELLAQGVLVCVGQDDISDAYYPYGRNNMLEVAFLASHLFWMTGASDMETLYDMITRNAAQAIGLQDFALKLGAPAHLVVLDAPNVLEALRDHAAPAYVISHGKLVDQAAMKALGGPVPA
jgi:cytosine deaminase